MEETDADQPRPPAAPAIRCCWSDSPDAGRRELRPAAIDRLACNPPVPPQQGRIWSYRQVDTAAVNTTTPYVHLNGAIAGVPEQGGAFYRDVPPGYYRITVDAEGNSRTPSQEVAVGAGQQIYARIRLGGSWKGYSMMPDQTLYGVPRHDRLVEVNTTEPQCRKRISATAS